MSEHERDHALKLLAIAESDRDDARRRLAEAEGLLRRARLLLGGWVIGGNPAGATDDFLVETRPLAIPPTAEPPRCKHGITGPCRRCATTGRDEP